MADLSRMVYNLLSQYAEASWRKNARWQNWVTYVCCLLFVDMDTHADAAALCCRASKAPFTFIVQIMFGNPSLSLTFSWAAPDPASQQHLSTKLTKAMSKDIGPDSTSDWTADEDDLVDKPFELTLAR